MDRFIKALATAFVITLGMLLWIGAIASLLISCASHKERVSIHQNDSISIVIDSSAHSSSFESMIIRNFSFDSLIFSEKVVFDSACPETAHGSERTLIIRGFKASTTENNKGTEESQSKREALTEQHKKDSTQNNSSTETAGSSLISTKLPAKLIIIGLLVIIFLYYKCYKKK